MIPGEYRLRPEPIHCNSGREAIAVDVVNRGDRPVQVGSHYHFAEANRALEFDREAAWISPPAPRRASSRGTGAPCGSWNSPGGVRCTVCPTP